MNKGFLMLSFYVNTDQIHSYERLLFILCWLLSIWERRVERL